MTAPSDRKLLDWLDDEPDKLERYLAQHPEEADRLETLVPPPAALHESLQHALETPVGLLERLREAMRPDPAMREAATVVGDLFSLPWETARTLFGEHGDL
ncbi:MAG: hypothetical protein ACKVWR_13585 [Acidimicrobiales bacterium]